MKTLVSISIAAAGLWVIPAIPAEPNDIMICQDVRDQLIILEAGLLDPHVRPLSLLSKGSQHIIELATATDEASVSDDVGFQDYLTALKRKFRPDSKLDDAMREVLSSGYDEIDSLSNDQMRAATNSSGSAPCTTFLFFQVQPNGASKLLPDPPQSMDGSMSLDIGPRRIECYVSDGHLAKIKGQTVFLVADYDPTAFESDVRISTFENGRWTGGCGVDISFAIDYKLAALSVDDTSAVTREDLAKYSPQIAHALDATSGPYELTYGGHSTSKQLDAAMQAISDIWTGKIHLRGGLPEPGEHVRFNENATLSDTSSRFYPISFHGEVYVLQAKHLSIGWRDLPGYIAAIYRVDRDRLTPIATVEIDAAQGPFKGATAKPLEQAN